MAVTPAALFVFAHQDDEIAAASRIVFELRRGAPVHCVFLTDGTGANVPAAVRNGESAAVLARLGVDSNYASFFYRVVHRWYFDRASLAKCAQLAGFEVARVRYVHRYPLSNALAWLRDREPKGRERLAGITELADELWRQFLVESGQTDCIYMELCTRQNASSP